MAEDSNAKGFAALEEGGMSLKVNFAGSGLALDRGELWEVVVAEEWGAGLRSANEDGCLLGSKEYARTEEEEPDFEDLVGGEGVGETLTVERPSTTKRHQLSTAQRLVRKKEHLRWSQVRIITVSNGHKRRICTLTDELDGGNRVSNTFDLRRENRYPRLFFSHLSRI